MLRNLLLKIVSCSSADEGDSNIDPTHKAIREKERRQANNVRERYVTYLHDDDDYHQIYYYIILFTYIFHLQLIKTSSEQLVGE